MNKKISWLFLPFILCGLACHRQPPVKPAALGNCHVMTARVAFQIFGQDSIATSFLASCQNGDWRLVVKADWGTSFLDIKKEGKKYKYLQKPASLPAHELAELGEKLSLRLDSPDKSADFNLKTKSLLLDLTVLSDKVLTKDQAEKIFTE